MNTKHYGNKPLELDVILNRKFRVDHLVKLNTISGEAIQLYGQFVLTRTYFKIIIINQEIISAFNSIGKVENEVFDIRTFDNHYLLFKHSRMKLH